ncbi:MAG: DUF1570 domain-containing protein [Proteobacteria bacterium]|nr:DUF1570 domain-containing protein [Pseudomonadota bacterium]
MNKLHRTAALIAVQAVAGLLVVEAQSGQAWAEPFQRHPVVAALPEIARFDSGMTVIILRGKLTARRARRMTRLARAVYRDVNQRFVGPRFVQMDGVRRDRRKPIPVDFCLFDSNRSYHAFVTAVFGAGDHSPMGFYSPAKRVAVANLARSVGNLRHELVHPLVGDDFAKIPAWLNEGLGSLYGTARQTQRQGRRFRFVVNYRLRHFRAADRRGQLPALGDLASSSHRQVRGDTAATYYAMSRYVLLYLDRRGQLDEFYRAMRARAPTPARQLALLQRYIDYDEFLAWARKLRYKQSGI